MKRVLLCPLNLFGFVTFGFLRTRLRSGFIERQSHQTKEDTEIFEMPTSQFLLIISFIFHNCVVPQIDLISFLHFIIY